MHTYIYDILHMIVLYFVTRWLRGLWRRRKCCRAENKVNSVPEIKVSMNDYLERERLKPLLGDFTLGEYTEKVVMYGYLMVSYDRKW